MKNYESEAHARWGNTAAYREHQQKTKSYTKEKWAEANDGLGGNVYERDMMEMIKDYEP